MTGFDDSSDIDQLFHDPTFLAELDRASKSAFKKFSNPPYDTWEDLKSDVCLKLCVSDKFARYREVTNQKGYLYKIALNLVIDKHRRRGSHTEVNIDDVENMTLEAQDWTAKKIEDVILTKEVLALLQINERFVLELWKQGMTFAEIAENLKVSPMTISNRFSKIIEKIHRLLRGKLD